MSSNYDDVLPPLTSEDKMMAGSCYPFWPVIPFFVLLSSKRQDPFLAFHALQAIAVGVISSLLTVIGLFFLWISFSSLPASWIMTSGAIGVTLLLAFLAFAGFCFLTQIFLGWQASSGKFLRIAGLGDFCEAKIARISDLNPAQVHKLAVDRELLPEEKITVIAPIATPEQMQAEMDRWAQPAAQAQSWWGNQPASTRETQTPEPAATQRPSPSSPPPTSPSPPIPRPTSPTQAEARPWKLTGNNPQGSTQAPVTRPTTTPEVKPWRPGSTQQTPATRPVSFPTVSREVPEEKKKWWLPKET